MNKSKEMRISRDWANLKLIYDPVFADPYYEKEIIDMIPSLINKDYYIADIGAHQGLYTTLFSKFGNIVYAFDPHPENYKYLEDNINNNSIDNVKLFNIGLGSYDGEAILRSWNTGLYPGATGRHQYIIGDISDIEINTPIRKLDSIVEEYDIERLDFIKIDVEHWEYDVLRGANDTLERFHPKMIIEIHSSQNDISIKSLLIPIGYNIKEFSATIPSMRHTGKYFLAEYK